MTKKNYKFFLFRSRDQKCVKQKNIKKPAFFTSPEDRMYITVSGTQMNVFKYTIPL